MRRFSVLFIFSTFISLTCAHATDLTVSEGITQDFIKTNNITPDLADVNLQTLVKMDDEQLSEVQGQALFSLSYLAPGAVGNAQTGNIGFYTLSTEADISINANIKNLQVGCGGGNGEGVCDIDIQNFSLGCIANSAGTCISLPTNTIGSAKNNPATHTTNANTVADTLSNQQQMKDFVLTNPFFQFAVRNPTTASTREVVGVRIGAANAKGPMSFNDIVTFSGYLSGLADVTMQGQTNTALTTTTGYAPKGNRTPAYDYNLGLTNWCLLSVLICAAQADEYQVSFNGQKRLWAVDQIGSRFSQGYIRNTDLDKIVRGVVDSVEVVRTYNLFGTALGNVVMGIISENVYNKIMGQLAGGLGVETSKVPGLNIPYNLSNVGSLDVDTKDFGLSFQSVPIAYPGYYKYAFNSNNTDRTSSNYVKTSEAATMPQGWAMYLPNAFTLKISQPMSDFTSSILGGGAKAGNIVGLPAPYRNCYGTLTFC